MLTTGSSGLVTATGLSGLASGRTTCSIGRTTVVLPPDRPPAVAIRPLASSAPMAPASRARLHARVSRPGAVTSAGAGAGSGGAMADGHGVTFSSEGCRQRRSSGWSQPPSGAPAGSSSSSPSSPFMRARVLAERLRFRSGSTMAEAEIPSSGDDWLAVTGDVLPVGDAYDWAVRADCGGVVLFSGTVRDHAEGRLGVTSLEYEAYAEQVLPRLAAIAAEIRARWSDVG